MAACALLLGGACHGTLAGDWPQILGPTRSGRADGEKLAEAFPSGGSRIAWKQKVGGGYAGPVVMGNQVILFHRLDDQERVECWQAETGKPLWSADFPATYRGGIDADLGPRCVPLVKDERVYVYGAGGDLHCVTLATGKKLWSRALLADYTADEGYFGAGSTPIHIGGRLLVNVGGKKGAGLVALDPANGQTVWQATNEIASYSSPTAAEIDGRPWAVFVTRMNVVAVDPAQGTAKILFPFGKRGPTVNAATPLVFNKQLFVSASYNVGAALCRLDAKGAKQIWANDETLSSQYATAVEHAGYLYGTHGREDVGGAEFRCVEAATGKVLWSRPEIGVAHVILAGDKLLLWTIKGQLILAAANPREYQELAAAQISSALTRALPALSGGRFFFRTNQGGSGELSCVPLVEKR